MYVATLIQLGNRANKPFSTFSAFEHVLACKFSKQINRIEDKGWKRKGDLQ